MRRGIDSAAITYHRHALGDYESPANVYLTFCQSTSQCGSHDIGATTKEAQLKTHEWIARLSVFSLLSVSACSAEVDSVEGETFEVVGGQVTFRRNASVDVLGRAELEAYVADRQYVRALAPRGVAFGINHADPRQHRFVVTRMKLAGKTRESSPQLFKMRDERKASQEAKGLRPGAVAAIAASDGKRASQHDALTTTVSQESQTILSGALASRQDQLSYGYVDSATWDEFGNPLGEMTLVEVFGNMPFSVTQSLGDPAMAEGEHVEGDSFLSETLAGSSRLQQSYVIAEPQPILSVNALDLPTVEHPTDVDGNGAAVVCLDRQWTLDCEYNNTGMLTLKVPLKGSVSVNGVGTNIDTAALALYKTAAGPHPGKIYVTLGTNGGGCQLPQSGQNITTMHDFWRRTTATPANNPTKLSWDLHTDPATWASFSDSCRLVQDTAYVTMEIPVPYVNHISGVRGSFPVTISNAPSDRPLFPPNLQFSPPLRITNSCLAEGTLVAVAGGEPRPVEELGIGDAVLSPYASSLTITDTAAGTERQPMVRIADASGRELLMTETHPLQVVDRGMVPAKLLAVGDRVVTDRGASELVRVTRESYTGRVFNLKVGTPEEARALGVDQTAVFANGFVVGDGQIQGKYESLEMHAGDAAARKTLPMRWRTDYLTSLRSAEGGGS